MFQIQNVEEQARGIKHIGVYHSEIELSHIEWISESHILLYNKAREFKLLYIHLLKTRSQLKKLSNQEETSSQRSLNDPNAVIDIKISDLNVAFHIYHDPGDHQEKMQQVQKPVLFYNNTIIGLPSIQKIYILGFDKLYVGRQLAWKEQLEILKNKAEWLTALSFCVSLYKGDNLWFANLPPQKAQRKKLLRQYSSELISDYITSITTLNGTPDPDEPNDIWKTTMLTVIDFLVSVDNFDFLFVEIKHLFEAWDMRGEFLEALESFILRNRIKFIPNEPFRDLVKHYTKKRKTEVLQYLIVNLSLDDIDIDYVITLCMEYNLLTALMYLCSHREGAEGSDFLTPIARSLSTYQRSVEEKKSDSQELGYRFLWFVEMTLKGKMFPDGNISENIWKDKVK